MPSITVHILHDNTLTPDNRDKFSYLAGQYGQLVKFYNVEEHCANEIAEICEAFYQADIHRFTIATFYRLFIPQLLPDNIAKCIYLDSDIVVNLDIAELWQIELHGKILAAAPEINVDLLGYPFAHKKYLISGSIVESADYFNAGVLVINLEDLRTKKQLLMDGIKFISEHPQCDCFDQDVLNYLFSKNYVKIQEKFDVFINAERKIPHRPKKPRSAIYHYIASGLNLDTHDAFNRLWIKYFVQTPWFNGETIERLYSGFQQIHVELKSSMINLSAIMSGKTRGFFAFPNNIDGLTRFFAIRDDEEIIPAENQDSLRRLLDAMNASRGRKVFFIMVPDFPFQILIQAGFTPGRDFVNGIEFLSEAQGVPLNSYPLIQAM